MLFFCACFSQNDTVYWSGKVRDKSSGLPVKNAFIHLKLSNGGMYEAVSNDTGYYAIKLKTLFEKGELSIASDKNTQIVNRKTYGFIASKENLVFEFPKDGHITFDFALNQSPKCFLDMPEFRFRENTVMPISYKAFYTEDSLLSPEQLIRFYYELLSENPEIVMEFRGRCDPKEKNRQQLSEKRAHFVTDQLIAMGIPVARLMARGVGAPPALHVTDADLLPETEVQKQLARQRNRCVSMRIVSWDYADPNAPVKKPAQKEKSDNDETIGD